MDRRQLLARLPLFGAAVASPAVSAFAATSPADRMAYHLAEFQKAAQEADPTIAAWHVHPGFNPVPSPSARLPLLDKPDFTDLLKAALASTIETATH